MPQRADRKRLDAATTTADAEHATRRLTLTVMRRIDGLLHGDHLGILPGHGSEPADSREYVPGLDDVRRMDWAVTARTSIAHVRDLVADRELETTIVLDRSPSMCFGTAGVDKQELAAGAVATVAMMTLGSGNRVAGIMCDRDGVHRTSAAGGRAAVLRLVHEALRPVPDTTSRSRRSAGGRDAGGGDGSADQAGTTTALVAGLGAARAQARRRGLVVVVSDFLDPIDGEWVRLIGGLAHRHQVLAMEIGDPREDELPDVGTVVLVDPETGRFREVRATASVRARFSVAARQRHEAVTRTLRAAGIGHVALRTDRDWVRDLARFAVTHRRTAHAAGRGAVPGQAR